MLTVDLNRLSLRPGQLFLDIGCGEGRHTLAAHRVPGVYALGLDLSVKDLSTAISRIGDMAPHSPQGEVAFGVGDATTLPIADETVDAVVASEILEHIPNYLVVLEEVWRVLKPGGHFCLSVPRQWPEWVCWKLSEGYRNTPGGHIRIFDAMHLRREVERNGFSFMGRGSAHALHVPFWWLKCLFWRSEKEHRLVTAYHKLLVWDLLRRPWITRVFDALLNPVMGKSVVLYFSKPHRNDNLA
ncbi:MAG: class I SAM-dependent methyltransferase [Luminiphilus sp.]|nr:class I SAM-dependent methyltransferase [Luminiphilus sp.]